MSYALAHHRRAECALQAASVRAFSAGKSTAKTAGQNGDTPEQRGSVSQGDSMSTPAFFGMMGY